MASSYAPQPQLIAVPAPPLPPDLTPSALFLPLSAISIAAHRGKKIRTIGQIIDYDPIASLLLLSASSSSATAQRPTLLANVSIPLLGPSPALKNPYVTDTEGDLKRPRVKFDKGEWVCVVGWLDGSPPRRIVQGDSDGPYLPPLPLVLDLIHVSPSREPPLDAIFRGAQP